MKNKPKKGDVDIDLPDLFLPSFDLPELSLPGFADAPEDAAPVDVAAETKAELEDLRSDFLKRADAEKKRMEEAIDSEYWVAICFHTREQKEEFLEKLKLSELGDKYLDGMRVAKKLGVTLKPPGAQRTLKVPSKKLTDLT